MKNKLSYSILTLALAAGLIFVNTSSPGASPAMGSSAFNSSMQPGAVLLAQAVEQETPVVNQETGDVSAQETPAEPPTGDPGQTGNPEIGQAVEPESQPESSPQAEVSEPVKASDPEPQQAEESASQQQDAGAAEASAPEAQPTSEPAPQSEPEQDPQTAEPAQPRDSEQQQAGEPAPEASPEVQQSAEQPQTEPAPEQPAAAVAKETSPVKEREGKGKRKQEAAEAEAQMEAAGGEVTPEQIEAEAAKQAEQEATEPATVSAEAVEPNIEAPAAIEERIYNASQVPVAIVPDDISKEQRERLAAKEKKRREEQRERRIELIGAAAVGLAVGVLLPQLGGRVAADEGDRFVIERDGEYYVRKDDSFLLRDDGSLTEYEQLRGGRVRETITRPNGVQVITVRDPGGYMLRRVKVLPNGERIVLYDIRDEDRVEFVDYDMRLPPLRVRRPLDEYIVSARRADRRLFYDTFEAAPLENIEQGYSLQAVRDNERLRAMVSRVDLDTITFASGSAYVSLSQVRLLGDIAGAMLDVLDDDPSTVFLVEGHTDAVGSDLSNLTLSDRRAETVAQILVEAYGIPPENLVTQGYGEQFLKVNTDGPSQANRRVTIRNISPILYSQAR